MNEAISGDLHRLAGFVMGKIATDKTLKPEEKEVLISGVHIATHVLMSLSGINENLGRIAESLEAQQLAR